MLKCLARKTYTLGFLFAALWLLASGGAESESDKHRQPNIHTVRVNTTITADNVTGEGLNDLNYTRHSLSLSNEESLPCHIYCDTGHPFIMVISEDN